MQDNNNSNLPEKHRILIVEDDEDCAFTMKHILKKTYEIVHFFNAEDALANLGSGKYSVILMDIGLKGINGIEALKIIRKKSGFEKIPAVAVSAYAMNGDREKFLEEGFNHYISKPFNLQEVKSLVDSIVNSQD
jgi:CheY-like chemotaxis protein